MSSCFDTFGQVLVFSFPFENQFMSVVKVLFLEGSQEKFQLHESSYLTFLWVVSLLFALNSQFLFHSAGVKIEFFQSWHVFFNIFIVSLYGGSRFLLYNMSCGQC